MRIKLALAIVGSMSVLIGAGCSGADADTTVPPIDEASEDALKAELVPGIAAAEIAIDPLAAHITATKSVVALPSKLKKVTSALKKRAPSESAPRCMAAYRTRVRFLDEKAQEIASTSLICGFGTLKIAGKDDIDIKVVGDLKAVADMPLVPGDALWGITSVKVQSRQPEAAKTIKTASGIAELIGAIGADQAIDPTRPLPRCMANYSATFMRGEESIALAAFTCSAGQAAPRSVAANFTIDSPKANADPLAQGAIDLDPRPFLAVF